MQKVHPGHFIAYEGEGLRQCRIGKVLNVLEDKSEVSLHVYEARANHKLQISWSPQYSAPEGTSYEQQVVETVPAAKVLGVVELSKKGVFNHASSSRLARQGWRVDEASVRGGLVAPVGVPPTLSHQKTSRMRALVAACSHEAELRLSEKDALAWAHGVPAFVEIFDGEGGLSLAVATGGWAVAPGIDRRRQTYGVPWHLEREHAQGPPALPLVGSAAPRRNALRAPVRSVVAAR